jgi:exportin-5
MYSLGCLVDYQVAEKALPFCRALVHLAITTNHERLKQFILNKMLPTITLLLGGDLNSAISKLHCSLNPTRKDDARKLVICLCQEIYKAYIDNQASH